MSAKGQAKPQWTNGILLLEILVLDFGEKQPKDLRFEQQDL